MQLLQCLKDLQTPGGALSRRVGADAPWLCLLLGCNSTHAVPVAWGFILFSISRLISIMLGSLMTPVISLNNRIIIDQVRSSVPIQASAGSGVLPPLPTEGFPWGHSQSCPLPSDPCTWDPAPRATTGHGRLCLHCHLNALGGILAKGIETNAHQSEET